MAKIDMERRRMRRWNAPMLSTAEVARVPLTIAMRAQRGHLVVCPYLVWSNVAFAVALVDRVVTATDIITTTFHRLRPTNVDV